jgi:hypothetical protein
MYCPKITYCFNDDDIRALNERIKSIANNYNDDETGWFEVDETQHLVFIDDLDNMYTINLRGRFFRSDEPEFDLDFVTLEKDGISFSFDVNIFDDHL